MKIGKAGLVLLVLFILFFFSIYNAHPIQIYLFHLQSRPLPVFLLLISAFVFGALIAALYGILHSAKLKRQIRDLEKRNRLLQLENANGRNLGPAAGTRTDSFTE